jgi:hypothetical protein
MDSLNTFSFSKCPPQVSNRGQYIAYISSSRLVVRNSVTLALKESVDLPKEFAQKVVGIKWDKCIVEGDEDRLAVFTADEIRTYSIENPSGGAFHVGATILPGKHPIVNVEWMSIPYERDGEDSQYVRLIAFSISGLNCTVWTSDGIELEFANPKRSSLIQHGHSFALLTRQGTNDVVYDIELNDSLLYDSYKLSSMIDVKEIKWSPSNVWVAAIDNPVLGYKVGIWTVDGTHVNTFYGPDHKFLDRGGLGAATIAWIPGGYSGRDVLVIGDYSERLAILDTRNFRPISVVNHGDIYQQECCIWEETASDEGMKCK